MHKLMITAAASNSGKTAVTCGLLALLRRRGFDPCAFKCGPDYIDPMFHASVLGIESSNLDAFLAGEDGVRTAFAKGCVGHDAAVCEGVMGYYDGVKPPVSEAEDRVVGDTAAGGFGQTADCGVATPDAGQESKAGREASAPLPLYASAWHVAQLCGLPAVLVIRPKGAALTLAAVIRGMAAFPPEGCTAKGSDDKAIRRTDAGQDTSAGTGQAGCICGVILNDCSEMYYRAYASMIEQASGIPVLGYLPHMEEAGFESRHLGLMTAGEIEDLRMRIERIGAKMEETIDWKRLLAVMDSGDQNRETSGSGEKRGQKCREEVSDPVQTDHDVFRIGDGAPGGVSLVRRPDQAEGWRNQQTDADVNAVSIPSRAPVRIAVARDAAFNFIYAASIAALEEAGALIVYFSPLSDQALHEDIDGLYLPGGYPELYARQLAENAPMRESIRAAVSGEVPTIAECGGFLYLGEELADADGTVWPMVGALPGHGAGTGKLVRFGYGHIGCSRDSMLFRAGEAIPVHEFHYWDTTAPGEALTLTKHSTGRQWRFGYATDSLYAGFPHLYLAGRRGGETVQEGTNGTLDCDTSREGSEHQESLAERFVQAARRYRASRQTEQARGTVQDTALDIASSVRPKAGTVTED